MGGTFLQTWVQAWINPRSSVKYQHPSCSASWLLIQCGQLAYNPVTLTSRLWWTVPSKCEPKYALLFARHFITAKRKITNILSTLYFCSYLRGQSLSWRRDSGRRGFLLRQQVIVHIWADQEAERIVPILTWFSYSSSSVCCRTQLTRWCHPYSHSVPSWMWTFVKH